MREILFALALMAGALLAVDVYEAKRPPPLNLPEPIDPVLGNAEAVRILAHDSLTDADSARLCTIARGMVWSEIGAPLATFLRNDGRY